MGGHWVVLNWQLATRWRHFWTKESPHPIVLFVIADSTHHGWRLWHSGCTQPDMASLFAHATSFDPEFSDISTTRRGRFLASGSVLAEFPDLQLTAPVRDFARGGFSITAVAPLAPERALATRLRCEAESTPLVDVRVVHVRPDTSPDVFVIGFRFLDPADPRLRASLTMILRTPGCLIP